MKKYIILGIIIGILASFSQTVYAQSVFKSNQVGASPANNRVLLTNGTISTWVATSSLGITGNSGTVTSVDMTVPTGLSITGNPITTSGTLALSLTGGYVIPLTASTTEWATAYGSTTALTPAYFRGLLSGTSPITFNSGTGAIGFDFSTNNTWTGTNVFGNASSSNNTVSGILYLPALSNGCLEVSSGIVTSTGSNCGTGGGGITSLNGLTNSSQTLATSTGGTLFTITSAGSTHTFNFPTSPTFSTTTVDALLANEIFARTSAGLVLRASNGTVVADFGIGNSANATILGGLNVNNNVQASMFIASSTTGTSTFAGKLAIGTTTLPATYRLNVVGGASRFGSGASYFADLGDSTSLRAGYFTGNSNTAELGGFLNAGTFTGVAGASYLGGFSYAAQFSGNTLVTGLASMANLSLSGYFNDAHNATGTLGMVLTSTGTSTRWIATSSLGITGGGGTPGGSDGQVQFNDGGSFGGGSILYWDDVNSRLGIGTSTPARSFVTTGDINGLGNLYMGTQYLSPQLSGFGTTRHMAQIATSADDIVGLRLSNMSSGTLGGTGLILTNNRTTLDVAGLSQSYYAGMFMFNSNFNGAPYGITAVTGNDLGITNTDGRVVISAASSTGRIDLYAGSNGYLSGSQDATLSPLGYFGIGTTTPVAKLAIQGTSSQPTIPLFTIASSTSAGGIMFTALANGTIGVGSSTPNAHLTVRGTAGNTRPTLLVATSTGAPVLTVASNGNVGIGVLAPSSRLAILGTAGTGDVLNVASSSGSSMFIVRADGKVGVNNSTPGTRLEVSQTTSGGEVPIFSTAYAGAAGVMARRANGTIGSPTALASGDIIGGVFARGYNGSAFTTSANGTISIVAGETWSAGANGTYLSFDTTNNGAIIRTEKMRLLGNGNLGIGSSTPIARLTVQGTTSSPTLDLLNISSSTNASMFIVKASGRVGIGSSTPAGKLGVVGSVFLDGLSTGTAGNAICINANKELVDAGGTTCTTSSERFKSNINDLQNSLRTVTRMRPVSFTRNNPSQSQPSGEEIGFIAEEVNDIDKRLVEYEADGVTPRGVNYQAYTAHLTGAIQALDEKIDNLDPLVADAKQKTTDNAQWIIIALLVGFVIRQQLQINKLK